MKNQGLHERMVMLKALTGEELDQRYFYFAATCAFSASGLVCALVWVPWAIDAEEELVERLSAVSDRHARELVFFRWAMPLIVGVSNLIFACIMAMRFVLNRSYSKTDVARNQLMASAAMNKELMNHRIKRLSNRLAKSGSLQRDLLQISEDRAQHYLIQHISHIRQLCAVVKVAGCSIIALFGASYVALQLAVADSPIASTLQTFLGLLFLTFVTFIYVSFHRLWRILSTWLMDLPVWTSAVALCHTEWTHAIFAILLTPVVPGILVISMLTQRVRRCRGINMSDGIFTARVETVLEYVWAWDWVSVVSWCYVVAEVMVLYKATPVLLNVLLAWMSSFIADLGFVWILASTFFAGMILFMIPPIPGPPIYLFGGVVIADKCPWGFWWGCVICIILSFALKLTACAIQQKLIGELLGTRMSVKRTVGVHKPFIRAVESVLRKPGLSFGKCMILCGGPDWPVSVLAGILRLSLYQCLLGTVPVIITVIPLCLTGSLYLKRDDGDAWIRTGNLMLSLTALGSVFFWAGMGWAIQDEFEKHQHELTRPKAQYLELDWLDYRSEYLATKCKVSWTDLPRLVRVPFAAGAFCSACAGLMIFWLNSLCFGTFRLTDDISDLEWFGADGLIRLPGLVALLVTISSRGGSVLCKIWRLRRNRRIIPGAVTELAALETPWKATRLREAQTKADDGRDDAQPSELASATEEACDTTCPDASELEVDSDTPGPEVPYASKWRLSSSDQQVDLDEWPTEESNDMPSCWPSCLPSPVPTPVVNVAPVSL
jgi:hypothetical protein